MTSITDRSSSALQLCTVKSQPSLIGAVVSTATGTVIDAQVGKNVCIFQRCGKSSSDPPRRNIDCCLKDHRLWQVDGASHMLCRKDLQGGNRQRANVYKIEDNVAEVPPYWPSMEPSDSESFSCIRRSIWYWHTRKIERENLSTTPSGSDWGRLSEVFIVTKALESSRISTSPRKGQTTHQDHLLSILFWKMQQRPLTIGLRG